MNSTKHASSVVVIGLGRFGGALAQELVELGREVLGIDSDEARVQEYANYLTHVVETDPTNEEALRDLGVQDFDAAVVAISSSIETSILTASILMQLGVKQVWAKAATEAHGRILSQIGVHHVVYPDSDMGKRIAHQVGGDQLDYVQIDEGFVLAKTRASADLAGQTLEQLGFRRRNGIIVIATSGTDNHYEAAGPSTLISEGDYLIVAGPKDKIDEFCAE
ncbi:MAG: TrkA family potassium uptake protein [Microbacteriaceae bacterium]|nr:TrkA family potassium uptake protein [Microbacteriaceae bacterium]